MALNSLSHRMITGWIFNSDSKKSAFVTSFPTNGIFSDIKKIPLKNCTNALIYRQNYKNESKKSEHCTIWQQVRISVRNCLKFENNFLNLCSQYFKKI